VAAEEIKPDPLSIETKEDVLSSGPFHSWRNVDSDAQLLIGKNGKLCSGSEKAIVMSSKDTKEQAVRYRPMVAQK
jgi:hypothetical protein